MGISDFDKDHHYFYDNARSHKMLEDLNRMLDLAGEMSAKKAELNAKLLNKKMNNKIITTISTAPFFIISFTLIYNFFGKGYTTFYFIILTSLSFTALLVLIVCFLKNNNEIDAISYEIEYQQRNFVKLINTINELFSYLRSKNEIQAFELYLIELKLDMLEFN